MPNLRRRLVRYLFRDEVALLREGIAAVAEAHHWVRADGGSSTPARFGEMDDQLADLIMSQAGWTRIGGVGGFRRLEEMFPEYQRQLAVTDSRLMYHSDPLVSAAIDMWTDDGFGQEISVTPTDPTLLPVFEEFWTAPRNRAVLGEANIQANSQKALQDGEYFWEVWASTLDGRCTIRGVTTDSIRDILTDPDDPATPLWYIKATDKGDAYYPDWRATPEQLAEHPIPSGAIDANTLRPLTRVVMLPIQRNVIGRRGWPQMAQALVWARAYKEFIQDRATVAKKAAMYVETLSLKNTNHRGVNDVLARLQSSLVTAGYGPDRNANTAAGQTFVQNDNAKLDWNTRDTGASGAQIDGLTIAGQFAATARTPLHWLGRPDAMQNQAVADSATLPWYEQMQRYQTFWKAALSDLVEVVGRMFNQYGGGGVTDFGAEIGMDSPFQNDITQIGAVLGQVPGAGLQPAVASQVSTALMKLALKALGIQDVKEVMAAPVLPVIAPATGLGLPGTQPTAAGPSDVVRAALALEAATAALDRAPSGGVNIIAGAEGVAMLQPPIVHNHIDLSALTEVIRSLPGAADVRPLLEAIAARPITNNNVIDVTALAEAIAAGQPEPIDVGALVAQLVAAIGALPAPVVNVANVIEQPTREKAKFAITYDGQGRITGATKTGETEPV